MPQHHALPTLLVRPPQGGTRVCELSHSPFTIGRMQGNDLCLEDPAVSASHARIITVQDVRFIEDLRGSSGTFVNGQKIDRHQLRDADTIQLGTHRLMFRIDHTAATHSAGAQGALTAEKPLVGPQRHGKPVHSPEPQVGIVEILSGKTGQAQYHLTRHTSLIGAQDDAVITLTGWLAPKSAALISRRNEGYAVSQTESGKRILINGRVAQGEQTLRHGDVVEVAGITMRFLLRAQSTSAA